jgi:hypothetical protein
MADLLCATMSRIMLVLGSLLSKAMFSSTHSDDKGISHTRYDPGGMVIVGFRCHLQLRQGVHGKLAKLVMTACLLKLGEWPTL